MTAVSMKAFRDAWTERTRSLLVIVTIAIGVAAVISLLGAYAILTRELNRQYLSTNPASAVLHVNPVDEPLLAALRSDPEIAAVEARRVLIGRVKTGSSHWHNLALFAIPDFHAIRLNQFTSDFGSWPPPQGDVLIERDAFRVMPVKSGNSVTVRIGDGQAHTLKVIGGVHDVGQPQARMENAVYGYISLATVSRLGQPALPNVVLIQVAKDKYNADHIRRVVDLLQHRLQSRGYRINAVDFPVPGKHPHADLMVGLLLTISSFGFFLVAMSGILALNFIAALMTKQVWQIGVMKTLGAQRSQLVRLYLVHALLLGAIATFAAIPAGMLAGVVLSKYMADILNFDIANASMPLWVLLTGIGVGLAIPVAASLIPVLRTVAIPVRQALASIGTSREVFGDKWLDRALLRVSTGLRPVLLSVRNSFRRRLRFALTCLALACGAMFFIAAVNVRDSMRYTYSRLFAAEKFDLTLYLDKMYPVSRVAQAVRTVPSIASAEYWIADEGQIINSQRPDQENHRAAVPGSVNGRSNTFTVIELPRNSQLFQPVLVKGRQLRDAESDGIVINSAMAARLQHVQIGDALHLKIGTADRVWHVVGISRELPSPPAAYVAADANGPLDSSSTNLVKIAVRGSSSVSLEQMRQAIDPAFDRAGIRIDGTGNSAEYHTAINEHVLIFYVFLVIASCVVAFVAGIGLMTTFSINVLERRREIGILRAIGASPVMVIAIVVGEAITVAAIAWAAGALLAVPVSAMLVKMIGTMLHVEFELKLSALAISAAFFASVVWAIASCIVAAVGAVRIPVRQALAYE